MAAKEKLHKHWDDAGYDPGQRQDLTVSFKKRKKKVVTVHVSFDVHSNGQDSYTSGQRWNHAYIRVYRIKENGDREKNEFKTHDWTYQLSGYKSSTSHNDNFTFNADYGETKFVITYENKRVGTNDPWYGPKSTGKVSETTLGTLKVDDAAKMDIKFYRGGIGEANVENMPADTKIYEGKTYTVTSKIPVDKLNRYVFNGWTTKKPESGVNLKNGSINGGDKIKDVEKDINLYACWKKQTYYYHYHPTKEDALAKTNEYTDLRQSRLYGDPGVLVPDLNGTDRCKAGYKHLGWIHDLPDDKDDAYHKLDVLDPDAVNHADCRRKADTYCWPVWEAIETKLIFNYGFNDYVRDFKFTITDAFNFMKACVDQEGNSVNNTLVRPGFRLVGWSYAQSEGILQPFSSTSSNYTFPYDYNGTISSWPDNTDLSVGINLYAVYEYHSRVFVYTNGKWRLALPFVAKKDPYKIISWQSAYPFVYSKDDWRWSGDSKTKEPEPEPEVPVGVEPFACYDSSNNTLTFFTDVIGKYENGQQEETITYYTGIDDTREVIPWEEVKEEIKQVVFKDTIYPFTVANWFSGCEDLETITDFNKISLGLCYDMTEMCKGCISLTDISLNSVDMTRVESMESAFEDCLSLTLINFSGAKAEVLYSIKSAFAGCEKLENVSIPIDTSQVRDMSYLFAGCSSLKSAHLETFTTAFVKDMSHMFDGCASLTTVYIDGFTTPEVTNMEAMFKDCSKITRLDLTKFNTSNVTNMTSMFEGCSSLLEIYAVKNNPNTAKTYSGQFNRSKLPQTEEEITGEDGSTVKVIKYQNSDNMFLGCTSLVGRGVGTQKTEKKHNTKKDKSNYIEEKEVANGFKYNAEKVNATYAQVAWVFEDEKKVAKLNKDGEKIIDHYVVKVSKKNSKSTELVETKEFDKDKKEKAEKYAKEWNDKKNYEAKLSKVYKKLVTNTITNNEGYFREK